MTCCIRVTRPRSGAALALASASALSLSFLTTPTPNALAHGHVEVGDYELTIGFINEPAYQGEPNGLDLRVVRLAAEGAGGHHAEGATEGTPAAGGAGAEATGTEHDHAAEAEPLPVEDLETSLKADLIFGSATRTFDLEAQWGEPGAYTAEVLPTAVGDYTWRIYGDIAGTPVDVSMTSGSETFSAVLAKDTIAFPEVEPVVAEVQGRAEAASEAASAAAGSASQARLLAMLGLVIGGLGLVTAFAAWRGRGAS